MSPRRRTVDHALEFRASLRERGLGEDVPRHRPQDLRGPWFDSLGGAEYLGYRTREAFRVWASKNHVIPVDRKYAKADIDRAMANLARQSA